MLSSLTLEHFSVYSGGFLMLVVCVLDILERQLNVAMIYCVGYHRSRGVDYKQREIASETGLYVFCVSHDICPEIRTGCLRDDLQFFFCENRLLRRGRS